MAKRSGSKSSRSERRAERTRAERAREHGLPVSERRDAQLRNRTASPEPPREAGEDERGSDALVAGTKAGIPTLVKVVGVALVILIGVYFLGRERDRALTEPTPATSAAAPAAS